MDQLIHVPPGHMDTVIQLAEDVESEVLWSDPNQCTIKLPADSSDLHTPVGLQLQSVDDGPIAADEGNMLYHTLVQAESDAVFDNTPVQPAEVNTQYLAHVKPESDAVFYNTPVQPAEVNTQYLAHVNPESLI